MSKYILVYTGKIIQQIAKKTDVEGYTEGVIECFLPDKALSKHEETKWIKENNRRMSAICDFLNKNNL